MLREQGMQLYFKVHWMLKNKLTATPYLGMNVTALACFPPECGILTLAPSMCRTLSGDWAEDKTVERYLVHCQVRVIIQMWLSIIPHCFAVSWRAPCNLTGFRTACRSPLKLFWQGHILVLAFQSNHILWAMPGVAQMICVGTFVQLTSMQWLHLCNEQTLVCCMMLSSLKLKSAVVPVTQVLCPRPYFTCVSVPKFSVLVWGCARCYMYPKARTPGKCLWCCACSTRRNKNCHFYRKW